MRGVKPANALEVTGYTLLVDELTDPFQRPLSLATQRAGLLCPKFGGQLFKRRFHAGADLAAIAGAAPKASGFCVDHNRLAPAACRGDGRTQPGIARPHDQYIRIARWIHGQDGHRADLIVPIGMVPSCVGSAAVHRVTPFAGQANLAPRRCKG